LQGLDIALNHLSYVYIHKVVHTVNK